MTISPRFQAAGRKPYNFALSRRTLGCDAKAKDRAMTHVVTESCIKCKYTVCVPECPVNAIIPEEDLSEEQRKFTPLNAELAKIWPVITDAKPGPADADQWKDVKDKLKLLER